MTERLVVIVAPPDVTLLDVTGPWEVFCRAALYSPGMYRVLLASTEECTTVRTKFGLDIVCHCSVMDVDAAADTILVAGSEHGSQRYCAVNAPPRKFSSIFSTRPNRRSMPAALGAHRAKWSPP